MPYWARADLEARLSASIVEALFDDDNSGDPDTNPITQLQADSASYVEGAIRGVYSLAAVRAAPPNEIKRLALDAAVYYAATRHPEVLQRDWKTLKSVLDTDLEALRLGNRRLDVDGSPENASNQGGVVRSGDPNLPEAPPRTFADGMGDY
ncbi:MAG: phage protein Gp36 family protein [Polyangiaceae bacterium]